MNPNNTDDHIKAVAAQLRFGAFFVDQRAQLNAVYEARPLDGDQDAVTAYGDDITSYLTAFDDNLGACEASFSEAATATSEDIAAQHLMTQLTASGEWHDLEWFTSRAHMTRDGVNESLWAIVTAIQEGSFDGLGEEIDYAFNLAREELAMAVNALVPRDDDTQEAQ